jgi:hypothetical protein
LPGRVRTNEGGIDEAEEAGHDDPVDDPELGDGFPDEGAFDDLDPREAARARRRDREAEAERRALMRPGMGKVFRQILERQALDAEEPVGRRRRRRI